MKTAAIIAVSAMASEIGSAIGAALVARREEEQTPQDIQEVNLEDLFGAPEPVAPAPPVVHVNVVVNSYNEENDNSKRKKGGAEIPADLFQMESVCAGCGEASCEGCGGDDE